MDSKMRLLVIATILAFILLAGLMFFPIPDNNAQVFLALASMAFGFFFGSSMKQGGETAPSPFLASTEILQPLLGVSSAGVATKEQPKEVPAE